MKALSWRTKPEFQCRLTPTTDAHCGHPEMARAALSPLVAEAAKSSRSAPMRVVCFSTPRNPRRSSKELFRWAGPVVVVKQGAEGAMVWGNGELFKSTGDRGERCIPSGAGDAFDAGFVAGMLGGATLNEAMVLAAYCGSQSHRTTR